MGFLANLIKPKIAVMHLSLPPKFIAPARGRAMGRALAFGAMQIVVSESVNAMIAHFAVCVARLLSQRPF